jgi:hypothetical protein
LKLVNEKRRGPDETLMEGDVMVLLGAPAALTKSETRLLTSK